MRPPLSPEGITGSSLGPGEICLTFDDGPGPHTVAIAEYLADHGVQATFFVVGKHVVQRPDVVPRLRELGHEVGNHTDHHPDLRDLLRADGDLVAEVASTAAVLSTREPAVISFRPPYGAWSAEVAAALSRHVLTAARHVGPVMWDVDGRDWAAWEQGVDPAHCAQDYVRGIEELGQGIVLLHDSTADGEVLRARNRAKELVQVLVPRLAERGYQFLPLGELPEVAAARARGVTFGVAVPRRPSLAAVMVSHHEVLLRSGDRFLVAVNGGGGQLRHASEPSELDSRFEVVPISPDRAAFRSRTGHFLTRRLLEGGLEVTSSTLSTSTTFLCQPAGSDGDLE